MIKCHDVSALHSLSPDHVWSWLISKWKVARWMSHMREQTHPSSLQEPVHTQVQTKPSGHCNADSLTEPEAASVWDIWVTSITGVPLENTLKQKKTLPTCSQKQSFHRRTATVWTTTEVCQTEFYIAAKMWGQMHCSHSQWCTQHDSATEAGS